MTCQFLRFRRERPEFDWSMRAATFGRLAAAAMCLLALVALGCGKAKMEPPSARDVTEFHAAVQDGDATIVDRLLTVKPALVNATNEQGETPLKVAKSKNHDDVAEVIVKHGGHE